jgi:hypothetical protein
MDNTPKAPTYVSFEALATTHETIFLVPKDQFRLIGETKEGYVFSNMAYEEEKKDENSNTD